MSTWEKRCYSDGIPDEIPNKVMDSGRVPSYKALALSILRNDLILKGVGFEGKESKWYRVLKDGKKAENINQYDLFL